MSRRSRANTDPRRAGGAIAGPGGPQDRNAVVLDTASAVLLDGVTACVAHLTRSGEPINATALLLEGKVNASPDRVRILYLMDPTGAADVVAHLLALARRSGTEEAFGRLVSQSLAWT